MQLIAAYKCYNEQEFLPASIETIYPYVDGILVSVSTVPWGTQGKAPPVIKTGGMDNTCLKLKEMQDVGLTKIAWYFGRFDNEYEHVNDLLLKAIEVYPDMTHYLYIDADEGWTPEGIQRLRKIIEEDGTKFASWWAFKHCFFKNFHYRVSPRETTPAMVAFRIFSGSVRMFQPPPNCRQIAGTPRIISDKDLMFYHFSWVFKDDQEVLKKLTASTHRTQIVPGWYHNIWLKWNENRELTNLHPTHPYCWPSVKKFSLADIPEPFKRLEPYNKEDHCC